MASSTPEEHNRLLMGALQRLRNDNNEDYAHDLLHALIIDNRVAISYFFNKVWVLRCGLMWHCREREALHPLSSPPRQVQSWVPSFLERRTVNQTRRSLACSCPT